MKIKVGFTLPTADFKGYEYKELPVSMNISPDVAVNYDIEYSVVIPDYIFNELADSEPQFKTVFDVNNRNVSGLFSERTLQRKFKKTQTSTSITSLKQYLNSLTTFLNDKYSIETSTMKKKLFIYFKHSDNHTRNNLNAGYTGREISQSFRFFTGYEAMTDKFSGLNRNVSKQYITKIYYAPPNSSMSKLDTGFKEKEDLFLKLTNINQSVEDFESQYSIVDWTEEREDFCKKVQEKFVKVNEELDSFLKNLDDDKMEMLMASAGLKMLDK